MIPAAGSPISSARPSPNAATPLDVRRTRAGPKRPTRRSPAARPAAIVSEKAANPAAAVAGLVARASRR
jgi:hypothetical protein